MNTALYEKNKNLYKEEIAKQAPRGAYQSRIGEYSADRTELTIALRDEVLNFMWAVDHALIWKVEGKGQYFHGSIKKIRKSDAERFVKGMQAGTPIEDVILECMLDALEIKPPAPKVDIGALIAEKRHWEKVVRFGPGHHFGSDYSYLSYDETEAGAQKIVDDLEVQISTAIAERKRSY